MAWQTAGSLRGPKGDDGSDGQDGAPGRGISAAAIQGDGTLLITFTDATQQNLGVVKGADGKDGTSVSIEGSVATSADLPDDLTEADKGKGFITQDDGHLHVWTGVEFDDVGNVKGPKGDQGNQGNQGPRGSTWFTGHGAPGTIEGSLPGDLYLDLDDGTVYSLS